MTEKIYFKGLNGLRFLAAAVVIVGHLEMERHSKLYASNVYIQNLGGLSVTLFFVLSGFLITYLLLAEKEKSGDISARNFYARRILRIWPLYYLVVIVGFFLIPHLDIVDPALYHPYTKDFSKLLAFFLVLIPNLYAGNGFPGLYQTWSIGVEEQFYIMWPLLLKYIKSPAIAIKSFVLIWIALKFIVIIIAALRFSKLTWYIFQVMFFTRFECMGIGAICAFLLYRHKQELGTLFNWHGRILVYGSFIGLLCMGFFWKPLMHQVYALYFAYIILDISVFGNASRLLELQVLNYFGKISYGIYMYHGFAILIGLKIASIIFKTLPTHGAFLIVEYALCWGLAILLPIISYEMLEKRILGYKAQFAIIKT